MKKLLNTIYVTNPDSYLSLDGDNLVVMREEKKVRMPLHNVERIMTFGYTGASPALMGKCAKDGRELVFMTSSRKIPGTGRGRCQRQCFTAAAAVSGGR